MRCLPAMPRDGARWLRAKHVGFMLALLGAAAFEIQAQPIRPAAPPPRASRRPRLAVLVVFDQLREDYLTRWDALFGPDGFHRLERQGAWFQNCHYPYANTVTGAGHASVATGCSPDKHGVIANAWYDRARGENVNCVGSDRYDAVPAAPEPAKSGRGSKKKAKGASPDRLLVLTLADTLKKATRGRGRVVAVSLKDRSAVLPGGRQPDGCYWFDERSGSFITSTFYRDRLPSWVAEFNAARWVDRWAGQTWTRLLTDRDYRPLSSEDDAPGEGVPGMFSRTFPHAMQSPLLKSKANYYRAIAFSPFGNDLLLQFAKAAATAENLGADATPDLLCISFSSNDLIGHSWGPDSQEVLDVTLRSDLILKDLLAFLDAKVGKNNYALAVTADHGVCPLPEVVRKQGRDCGRISPQLLQKNAEAFLETKFGNGVRSRWLNVVEEPGIYLNQALLRERGLKKQDVEEALASWLRRQTGILTVYTHRQVVQGLPANDPIGQSVQRSFHPDRSGDLIVVLKPYYMLSGFLTGTTHGGPHPYDTHVPLLVYGPGIRPGIRREAVTPLATPVILAKLLGIPAPESAQEPLPHDLIQFQSN